MEVKKEPTEARQAKPEGVVRYVLIMSLAGAIVALAIVFFVFA